MTKGGVRVVNSHIVKAGVRVGIQTWGSEGDIRPFMALGHALASRGHQVELLYTDYSKAKGQSVLNSVNILVDLVVR